MSECIFCKIASGELGTEFVAETDELVAFNDINPAAPTHVLVIPKEHLENADVVGDGGRNDLAGKMMALAASVAGRLGVAEGGYRMVLNTGTDAGQEVAHMHLHLLGGRRLLWPPG